MFGQNKYEQLKAEDQFKVFSRQQLFEKNSHYSIWGKKSLLAVMPDKSLDNMVLIDDSTSHAPDAEQPLVFAPYFLTLISCTICWDCSSITLNL